MVLNLAAHYSQWGALKNSDVWFSPLEVLVLMGLRHGLGIRIFKVSPGDFNVQPGRARVMGRQTVQSQCLERPHTWFKAPLLPS